MSAVSAIVTKRWKATAVSLSQAQIGQFQSLSASFLYNYGKLPRQNGRGGSQAGFLFKHPSRTGGAIQPATL